MQSRLEPMILAPGSLFKEKLKYHLRRTARFFLAIFYLLKNIIISIKDKIKSAIDNLYYRLHPKLDSIKKKIKKFILISSIILFTLAIANHFFQLTGSNLFEFAFEVLISEIVFYIVLLLFLKWYHVNFGEESIYEMNWMYTREYVINYAPNIAKIWGITGKGKDELTAGLSTMKIDGFHQEINSKMNEIKQVCYFFDYDLLHKVINNNIDLFYSSSDKITKHNFHILCKEHNFFISKMYKKNILVSDFINSYKKSLENRVDYTSCFIFDAGGIDKKHLLTMLYEYVMLYVRECEGHFLFSNQPMIESFESGTPAGIFSQNYMIINNMENKRVNEKDELGNKQLVELSEKVQFPFKNYLGIIETEADTWWMNVDGETKKNISDLGLRDFKAYNRHFFDKFFMYQVSQSPDRTSKLFRELEHAYIHPDTREVYKGAIAINKPFLRKMNRLVKKNNKIEKKYYKKVNRNTHIEEKISLYSNYFLSSNKQKYKDKISKLKDKTIMYDLESILAVNKKKISNLLSEILINQYNHGYVTKIITVGHTATTSNGKELHSPSDILKNPDITRGDYSVKLTFRLSDCWKYNTHYMEAVKENRASQSELNLVDAPLWDKTLKLKKEDMVILGYSQGFRLFGIDKKQLEATRINRKKL